MTTQTINWATSLAAIWRSNRRSLRIVQRLDNIRMDDLLGIDRQKQQLIDNTERFLKRLPANNALLWGSRGTGKSSLIKALLNEYAQQGLRVIEVDKDDLSNLPDIVDDIRELPQRFIIFCDDLSFESHESQYKHLKSVLEGSIELPPENVLIYATSNRRHLLPEKMQDNIDSGLVDGELHYADAIEEKISLSDRFGLWLSFYPISQQQYLTIVDHLFADYLNSSESDRQQLHADALLFARTKGNRSGRTAKQFFHQTS
ncbi:MAG: ATP-binding protein [Arenicella sp.]